MIDDVAEEVDINDPPTLPEENDEDIEIEGEDLSKTESSGGGEWIEPARDVIFEITHASVHTYTPKTPNATWRSRSLKLYLRIDKGGVDGKGKYAGKVLFPNSFGNIGGLLITVNREAYDFTKNSKGEDSKFYAVGTGGAFNDYKEFLQSQGFPVAPTPKVTKQLLASLLGRKVMGNIEKKNRQVSDNGKYVDVKDEFENNVMKFRAVKIQEAPKAEEAVA